MTCERCGRQGSPRDAFCAGCGARLAASDASGHGPWTPTPFVDRREERGLLQSRFEQACDGAGQAVLLVGEPGIGKSRLARALADAIADTPHRWLEAGAAAEFAGTPYYAWARLLRQLVGLADPLAGVNIDAVAVALTRAGLDHMRALPLVAPLFGLTALEGYPVQLAAPEVARTHLLAILTAWVRGEARRQPLVLLLEDLHWADPSTLELQRLLIDEAATERLLLLYTARPEFVPTWPQRAHVTQLRVNRLRRAHVREMVLGVAAQSPLLGAVLDQVAARTDGVPLYVEELTRAMLEAEVDVVEHEIPDSLAESLRNRLARLGPTTQAVAEAAAVCGREFRHAVITAVEPLEREAVDRALQHLVQAELFHVRGLPPDATYTFKHALVQDAAYGLLSPERRRALHERVAAVLSAQFPEHTEVLAQHYAAAGDDAAAVAAWQRAGEWALERGALSEAAAHLRRAIDALARVGDAPGRPVQELRLQLMLCSVLGPHHGYGAPETMAAIARARAIGKDVADVDQLAALLFSTAMLSAVREGPVAAKPALDEFVALTSQPAGERWRGWAHMGRGLLAFFTGDYARALEQTTLAAERPDAVLLYGLPMDVTIMACGYGMYAAWHLGLDAEAHRRATRLSELAATSTRPTDRAWAHQLRTTFHATMLGDLEAAKVDGERALAACAEDPNPTQELAVRFVLGWVTGREGAIDAGLAAMQSALDSFIASGQRLRLGFNLGLMADLHARAGRTAEALRLLDQAEDACPSEECVGPTHRCQRAELLARSGADAAEVETRYREALDWARRQRAKWIERRVAVSFARWLGSRERSDEAQGLLAHFRQDPESDDSRDAREVRAALDALAAAASVASAGSAA